MGLVWKFWRVLPKSFLVTIYKSIVRLHLDYSFVRNCKGERARGGVGVMVPPGAFKLTTHFMKKSNLFNDTVYLQRGR